MSEQPAARPTPMDAVAPRGAARPRSFRRRPAHLPLANAPLNQAVLNSLTAQIAVLDEDGRIVAVNSAWEQFGGPKLSSSSTTAVGVNYLDVCRRAERSGLRDATQVLAGLGDLLAGRVETFTFEYEMQTPEDRLWFVLRATPLSGSARGAVVAHENITARKRAELALQASEERFRLIFQSAPIGIALADPEGYLLATNPAFQTMLGYSAVDLYFTPFCELVHPDEREAFSAAFHTIIDDAHGTYSGELRFIHRDGQQIWGRPNISVSRDQASATQHPIIVLEDITARRRDREELQASEERYRTLFETMSQGVVYQGKDGAITSANPAAQRLLGLSIDQMQARTSIDSRWHAIHEDGSDFHGDDHPSMLALHSGEEVRNVVMGVFNPSEERHRWILVHAIPQFRPGEDRPYQAYTTFEDITELKRVEAALMEERALLARRVAERTADLSAANAELARAARLKDEFLASMSHELRTPLNAVLGLAESLCESTYGPITTRQAQILQVITESGRHLLALINDILDLAKVGAGKLELDLSPVPVAELCEASLRMVRLEASKKRISIDLSLAAASPTVYGDSRRLKQVLVNLLSNAVKFTPAGGAIGLEVVADHGQNTARFTVWDTGIGIAPEQLGQLFQPFVQLDSRLARQYEGTGLGLALVYRMIQLHSGSVSVASEINVGSRFSVLLPLSTEPAGDPAGGPLTEDVAPPPFRHALVIEDSPTTAALVARFLQNMQIEAAVAGTGAEAVTKAAELAPDVILLDLLLPDMSGWQVLDHLKSCPRTAAIPVVIVSVIDDKEAAARGAAACLLKPFSQSELRQTLLQLRSATRQRGSTPERAEVRPTILLAEDNEANIMLISDYLVNSGYQVVAARNGAEAVAQAREIQPALILMDIQMPGMHGFEAIRRIRADASLARVPLLALTALAMPGDRERCLAAGADGYMGKPVSLPMLARTIGEYVLPAHTQQGAADEPTKYYSHRR